MNRKEFQQWLEQFPEDTIIRVAMQSSPSGWDSYGPVYFEEIAYSEPVKEDWLFCHDHCDYTDYSNNLHVKPDNKKYGKKYLDLGQTN